MGVFIAIIWITEIRISLLYMNNPPNVECKTTLDMLGKNSDFMAYFEYRQLVGTETNWRSNLNAKISRGGYLSCFCKQEEKTEKPSKLYNITGLDDMHVLDNLVPLCNKWYSLTNLFAYNALTASVSATVALA